MNIKRDETSVSEQREPKRVLGRGLSMLIPAAAKQVSDLPAPQSGGSSEEEAELRSIPLLKISLNPFQPRQEFEEDQLTELTESIKRHGVLQPIVVRSKGITTFELVAGERRFRAATKAGLKEIPAVVREMDDRSSLAIALIENIQRQDLNPVDSARAYRRLLVEFQLTQSELAAEVGKSQPTIANALRLLALPEPILARLSQREITEGHAKALLSVDSDETRLRLCDAVVREKLSVRELEKRAAAAATIPRGMSTPGDRRGLEQDMETVRLEQQLSLALGTRIKLRYAGKDSGQIEIQFYGSDQLEGLLLKLGGQVGTN